jgi:hypothetical protein
MLISLIATLHAVIKKQLPAIETPSEFVNNDIFLASRLKRLQNQHSDVQKLLTQTIDATRKMRSRAPWLDELVDVEVSIHKKIKQCNRMSRSDELGWRLAAERYWPSIVESYKIIEKLLDRLELLLNGIEAWNDGRRDKAGARAVKFGRVVMGQWVFEEDDVAWKYFTLPLTNDEGEAEGKGTRSCG